MNPLLRVLENEFTIYQFQPHVTVPPPALECSYCWVGKTDEELSIVCESSIKLAGEKRNTGWSCIKVLGPIDFSETGILAGISKVLSKARLSIFALSTFDTDYILVKSAQLKRATAALVEAGYEVQLP